MSDNLQKNGDAAAEARRALLATLAVVALVALWRAPVAAGVPLSIDESYYVAWSKSLAWGYWTKPPAIAWAIALARGACGEGAFCVRLVPLAAFAVSTLLFFALARRIGARPWSACLAACAFATLPLASFYGLAATTDGLLLLSWIAAMLAFRHALDGARWAWIAAGVAAGFGLLAKYSAGVFAFSALLVLLHPAWRRHLATPWPYLAALSAALVFSPNLLWNLANGMPTLHHTADISQGDAGYGFHPDVLAAFWAAQFGVGGPIVFGAFVVWSCYRPWKSSPDGWFLSAFALPILLVISLQALLARAHANWATPTYVAATLAAVLWLAARHRRWLAASFAVNLALAVVLYHFDALVARPFDLPKQVKYDPYWAMRNWPGIVAAVRDEAARRGVADGFAVASDDRALLAQLQANLPLPAGRALGWQRGAQPNNHFEQRFPLPARPTGPVLLITTADADAVRRAFPDARPAGRARSAVIVDRPLDYGLWWINA